MSDGWKSMNALVLQARTHRVRYWQERQRKSVKILFMHTHNNCNGTPQICNTKKKRRKKKKNYKLFEINRYKAFCCCCCCISYIKPILCNIKLKHMRADFFLLRFEISGFCVCWLYFVFSSSRRTFALDDCAKRQTKTLNLKIITNILTCDKIKCKIDGFFPLFSSDSINAMNFLRLVVLKHFQASWSMICFSVHKKSVEDENIRNEAYHACSHFFHSFTIEMAFGFYCNGKSEDEFDGKSK